MKRKLDANDIPSTASVEGTEQDDATTADFENLNLDPRLRQALIKEKFNKPTLVQAKAIPLALEGKDILGGFLCLYLVSIKSSGLTKISYQLVRRLAPARRRPMCSLFYRLSFRKRRCVIYKYSFFNLGNTDGHVLQTDSSLKATTGLILVPTRELAEQVQNVITTFTAFCGKDVRSVNLTQKVSDAVQHSMLADYPDIVVSTPARVVANLGSSALSLENLTHLVIDEADLVLSYGYEEDINGLAKAIPRGVQTFLMSATLTSEVDTLKGLFCRNPVTLKLEDKEDEGAGVSQFVVK